MMYRIGPNKKSLDPIDDNKPLYVQKVDETTEFAHRVYIHGPSRICYSEGDHDFKHVWLETSSEVVTNIRFQPKNTRIHIESTNILMNRRKKLNLPVCSITCDGYTRWCNEVIINGPSQMIYSKDAPQQVWIETNSEVTLIGESIDYVQNN